MRKIYILKNHNNILGVYSSREKAERAKEKIIDIEIKYNNICDMEFHIQDYKVL
jgi:hypothetical protein